MCHLYDGVLCWWKSPLPTLFTYLPPRMYWRLVDAIIHLSLVCWSCWRSSHFYFLHLWIMIYYVKTDFDLMEILSLTIKECITTGWCDFSLAHHVHCSSYIYLFSSEWWIINLTRKIVFDGLLKHIQLCACSTCWLLYHIFSTLFTLS